MLSIFPIQISIFGEKIYLHILFETLAFIVGIRVYYYIRKKQKNDYLNDIQRLYVLLGAMLGAFIGSRLLAAFEIKDFFHPFHWVAFYSNKTVFGGFIGGLFGVEIMKKIVGIKQSTGDIYVIPILIALFIGRIGCFSMGIAELTYGLETSAITGMDLGDGKLRHPIMLYEMAFLLFFFFIIKRKWFHQKIYRQQGDTFACFMIAYSIFRFGIEFIKPIYPIFLHLSIIQWAAIGMMIYYYRTIKHIVNHFYG